MKIDLISKGLFLFVVILILAACGGGAPVPQGTPVPVEVVPTQSAQQPASGGEVATLPIDWFIPSAYISASWNASMDPANENVALLTLKAGEPNYKLFFLLTKGHVLFDRAIEQVLMTFRDRGFVVDVAVILAPDEASVLDALKYAEDKGYDLIYPIGSDAATFVHNNYQGGKLPVVMLLSKDPVLLGQMPDYSNGSGTNIAYTSVSVPVDLQMTYFRQLVPDLKNIAVLYDTSNSSAVKTQVEPLDIYAQINGLNVIHVANSQDDVEAARKDVEAQMPEALKTLRDLDPENKQSIFLVTNSGTIVKVFDTVDVLAENVPVVSLLPDLVQEGDISAVMSVGVSFDSNSILAAVYGVRILSEGVDPGSLPVGVITPPDVAISFAKAREIGLQIPFTMFESATFVYDPQGKLAREKGQLVP
jgi:putative ABC transport system substrate-binding protein